MDTKTCNRCKKLGRPSEHPISEFYKNSDGTPLSTCKACRKELSARYHKKVIREEKAAKRIPETGTRVYPADVIARTIISVDLPTGPKIAVWRCMSCYRKAVTRASGDRGPDLPAMWKQMKLNLGGKDEPVIVCGPCFTTLAKAQRVLSRITDRVEQERREYEREQKKQ